MPNRLASIAGQAGCLERGVYLEPVRCRGRPVLVAVDESGERIATRTWEDGEQLSDVVHEMRELLDRSDTRGDAESPKLRLVADD